MDVTTAATATEEATAAEPGGAGATASTAAQPPSLAPPAAESSAAAETLRSSAEEGRAAGAWRVPAGLIPGELLLAPLGGALALALAEPQRPARAAVLGFSAVAVGTALARRVAPQAALLPLMRRVQPLFGPALAVAGLALLELLTGQPSASPLQLLVAFAAAALPGQALAAARRAGGVRVAFIGSAPSAERLARALEAGGSSRHRLVGRITCPSEPSTNGDQPVVRPLGAIDELARIVAQERIDLLVMGAEAPRLSVFGELAESCLDLPVRLVELSDLFEEVFGHVATAEINATWFKCLSDPHARRASGPLKRAIDLTVASVMLICSAPLLGALILLVRRDGGPGLFRQVRIGERGRRFRLCKLRTMVVGADATAQWAEPDDPRMTRLGAFLRKTHFDELPQLVNVIRGEMSLVGPRPEQPEFVDRLERTLPFYQRRHLMRPGITGWAQIRCGYAGSDIGSAWKLCHDLYYAKHRSVGVDLLILGETVANLVFEREPVLTAESEAFVLAGERR